MKLYLKIAGFFFSGYFNLIASLASIIGLLIVVFSDKNAIIVALISIILFLSLILIRFFTVTKTFILQKTENGYLKFATYMRYSTEDGKHIIYDLHKYIQCKTIIMNEHEHNFYWSGTEAPKITSSLQDFQEYIPTPKGQFDKAIFRFRKPLIYNEFAIVHIRMDLNDEDGKAKPFCEQYVNEPIQLLSFRVELRHITANDDAKIYKKRLGTPIAYEYEQIDYVRFDPNARSYDYQIFNPAVGYCYKLEWVKK